MRRYHEISESSHRILNPLSPGKLELLGEIVGVDEHTRHLDLASGKGEMLCQYARRHGSSGVGVDSAAPFVELARRRAAELGVADRVEFVLGDAAEPRRDGEAFGLVSCLGATWIGGGLLGTLQLMSSAAAPHAWMLVGEVFWAREPSASLLARYGDPGTFADLAGTLGRFEAAGVELVEMVLASPDDWDRYAASQWCNVAAWLDAHRDDPEAAEVRATRDESRLRYLEEERGALGWGVFVLRTP